MKKQDNYLKNKKGLKATACAIAASTLITSMSGCAKYAECDIEESHAHMYTNSQGLIRYINTEYEEYEGFERHDEFIPIASGEEALYNFFDKKDIMNLADNYEQLLNIQEQNKDHIEYEYIYYTKTFVKAGKTLVPVRHKHYGWTADQTHSDLTGNTRMCHYMYQACNICIDDNGQYVVIPSEWVDDISVLIDQYDYIKGDYIKEVYSSVGLEDTNDMTEGTVSAHNNRAKRLCLKREA